MSKVRIEGNLLRYAASVSEALEAVAKRDVEYGQLHIKRVEIAFDDEVVGELVINDTDDFSLEVESGE